jgi:hypothetical protein
MADYVFYPVTVTGSPGTNPYSYAWTTNQVFFNTGSYWAQESSPNIGTPPTSTGTVPGAGDTAIIVSGTVNATDLGLYNYFAPNLNDPTVSPSSGKFIADIAINGGSVQLSELVLAGFSYGVSNTLVPTLGVQGGTLHITGSVIDTVSASVVGNAVTASGGGTIDLSSASLVEIGGTVESDINFGFLDTSGERLALNATQNETISVSGSMNGNTIELTGIGTGISVTGSYDAGTNQYIVTIGDPTTLTFDVANLANAGSLHVAQIGNSFELITCFAAGTRIRTPSGEVAVEALREGDLVRLARSDETRPVRWIGHRRIDCRRHPHPELVWPVRIAAGAFGAALPERDLFVSPDHAVFVDGVLIPVRHLIDGVAIAQQPCDAVTYYHVELVSHEVILAEGLPVESYLDTDGRAFFDNGGGVISLHPAPPAMETVLRVWEARGCAPLVVTGPVLEGVRARLRRHAAAMAQDAAA